MGRFEVGSASESGESEAERNNRNLSDLLQELRVAGLGVQVLFGFLLSLPFTMRFKQLNELERALYRVSLLSAALAIALLVSPVAYHRWVFRRHEKGRLLRYANTQALLGLAMVGLAICIAVWMVLLFVGLNWPTGLVASVTVGCFATFWFGLPIADRIGADRQQGSPEKRTGSSVLDRKQDVRADRKCAVEQTDEELFF